MMLSRFALTCIFATLATVALAQDKDVDQADTLDFQSFHKDKKEAVKVWDKKSDSTIKAYSDQNAEQKPAADTKPSASTTTAAGGEAKALDSKTTAVSNQDIQGKRYEIRERYTLSRSAKTPYTAFFVIEPLHKQAAQLCPKGWKKLSERSEPVEQDFYLYYNIECL